MNLATKLFLLIVFAIPVATAIWALWRTHSDQGWAKAQKEGIVPIRHTTAQQFEASFHVSQDPEKRIPTAVINTGEIKGVQDFLQRKYGHQQRVSFSNQQLEDYRLDNLTERTHKEHCYPWCSGAYRKGRFVSCECGELQKNLPNQAQGKVKGR